MKLRILPASLIIGALFALAACSGGGTSSVPAPHSAQSGSQGLTPSSVGEPGNGNNVRIANTFDSFNAGPAAGQQGWIGSACGYSLSHVDSTATYPNAKFSGPTPPSKVLVVQNAATDGCYNGLGSPPVTPPAGRADSYTNSTTWTACGSTCVSSFSASWTVTSSTGGYQDGLGMSVSPVYNNTGARMAYVGMEYAQNPANHQPSFHVFAYDVQGVCADASCGPTGPPPCLGCANFVYHDVAYLDPNVEHTLGIVMDFVGQRDKVRVTVDNGTAWVGGSWQDFFILDTESDPGAAHPHSRAVNDLLLHGNGSNGVGFLFRNVTVSTK